MHLALQDLGSVVRYHAGQMFPASRSRVHCAETLHAPVAWHCHKFRSEPTMHLGHIGFRVGYMEAISSST